MALEDSVVTAVHSLFGVTANRWALVGSASLGAGVPDLALAAFRPNLWRIPIGSREVPTLLGYLRSVGLARPETIRRRLGWSPEGTGKLLRLLEQSFILNRRGAAYALRPTWRSILTDVIAIEVKVKNWDDAVRQAIRNNVFSHTSYVALPIRVAQRVRIDPRVSSFGIGVLAIEGNGDVSMIRRARRSPPQVWPYYYELARKVAHTRGPPRNALRRHHQGR